MTKSCSAQWNCPHTTEDLILNHVIKPEDKNSVNTLPLIETKFILVHFKELTIYKFYLFLPALAELKSKSLHMHMAAETLQQAVRATPRCRRASGPGALGAKSTAPEPMVTEELGAPWQPIVQGPALSCTRGIWTLAPSLSSQNSLEDLPLISVLVLVQPPEPTD